MPHLNHNGFVSYWQYFDSCSPETFKSDVAISFDFLSKCTLGFFSKYLKPDPLLNDSTFLTGLFAEETQVNILGRMFIDSQIDLTIHLYLYNVEKHQDSWRAHYELGYVYKVKGETLLAKNELLIAKELNPENPDIKNLLVEVNQ